MKNFFQEPSKFITYYTRTVVHSVKIVYENQRRPIIY